MNIEEQISLDFEQAKAKHLLFKSRLRSLLYGAEVDQITLLSQFECGLGKWIYNYALKTYQEIPEINELEKVHSDIHECARHLIHLYKNGKVEDARIGLSEMEDIADRVQGLLVLIEGKVKDTPVQEINHNLLNISTSEFNDLLSSNEELDRRIKEQMAETLRQKERFELIAKATQDAVWDWDLLSDKIWWNEGFKSMFGYKQEEIEPGIESWYNRIHPGDAQRVVDEIHAIIDKGGKQWTGEYRFRRANGSYAYILDRGYCLHTENGKPYRMVGSMQDITERTLAEEAIKESEARFRQMADSLPLAIWLSDQHGRVRFLNKWWLDYSGATYEPSLTTAAEIADNNIHPEDAVKVTEAFQEAIRTGTSFRVEQRNRSANGEYRWFLNQGEPYRDLITGEISGWFGAGTDIHDRKLAESSLADKNQELTRINNDLDNFIYTASHDLKAPMSNIEGLLNTLRIHLESEKEKLDLETEKILQYMEKSISRFKSTILDLTEITKLQKVREEDIGDVSFEEVLEDVKLSINDKIKESGASIESDFSPAISIRFSKKNLKSIVYNLITNAIKYRDSSRMPEIRIKTEVSGNELILSVKDNGLGISSEQLPKIFDMFKRVHNHVEGTGIGLYIVKRIIDNAGGRIEVESEVGKGTAFRVYLKMEK